LFITIAACLFLLTTTIFGNNIGAFHNRSVGDTFMANTVKKSFDQPEETRAVPKGTIEVVNLGDVQAMRATFEPGWKWSESVKPIAGTDSCQVAHMGFMVSGKMIVKMDDGTEYTLNAGDAATIPPGHDAWIVGDEKCVFIDFQGAATYAKPKETQTTA
jgi:hypothetical protein